MGFDEMVKVRNLGTAGGSREQDKNESQRESSNDKNLADFDASNPTAFDPYQMMYQQMYNNGGGLEIPEDTFEDEEEETKKEKNR
jgi:hypothetical protein